MTDTPLPLIWREHPGNKYCVVLALNGVERGYELTKGVSRAKGFPPDAYFQMDKQFKKQVALSDNVANLDSMPLVSQRLKTFIEERKPKRIEFLRVKILDHKDKPVKDDYFIVNPLTVVDCIDTQQSKFMWNSIDPELIAGITKLVLKPKAIDPELLMFRPKHDEGRVFLRRDLAQEIQTAGFTGVTFIEPSKFVG
jgi:Immunity protein family (Imm11)